MPSLTRSLRSAELAARVARTKTRREVHPFVVFLNITRRCNLACSYCHEYDHQSAPVPLASLRERIAHIARLGSAIVTVNGGEPLTHPDLFEVVSTIRARDMAATLITNAFLLRREDIAELNRVGLGAMQVSVDGLEPTAWSLKSLRSVRTKLEWLAQDARFPVHLNAVLSPQTSQAQIEALRREVKGLGMHLKVALVRGSDGAVASGLDAARGLAIRASRRGAVARLLVPPEQAALARGEQLSWRCRAGARYLHVCERGLVHPCGAKLGTGTIAIADYTQRDLDAAFAAPKPCASRCGVAYAHGLSRLDAHRSQRGRTQRVHLEVLS